MTQEIDRILANYSSDNPGVRSNLARILNQGRLGGTGRLVILPVDQGFEHGPARSFAVNPAGYDPLYHHSLAIEAGLSAYAAPLGALEVSAPVFAGQIPTILKVNHANSLSRKKEDADQSVVATVDDALRLGCSAVGFTIYPGSDASGEMMEEVSDMIREAKEVGLASVVWSYPRGGSVSKEGETAIDVVAYGAHMACLLGAHVVKVKLPTAAIELSEAKAAFDKGKIKTGSPAELVAEVVRSCFNGRRIVVFSGGAAKGTDSVHDDARAIRDGGGNGAIIGRNSFQRPKAEALDLLGRLVAIFKGQD